MSFRLFCCPAAWRSASQPRGFPADGGSPGLRRRCLRWPHGSRRREPRRFRPYSEYTDSGVEWMGELPAHWEVRRLKTTASVQLSNVDKHSEEGQIPLRLCNYVDMYYNDLITADLEFMITQPPHTSRCGRFRLSLRRRGCSPRIRNPGLTSQFLRPWEKTCRMCCVDTIWHTDSSRGRASMAGFLLASSRATCGRGISFTLRRME